MLSEQKNWRLDEREAYQALLKLQSVWKSLGLLVEMHLLLPLAWVGPEVLHL